MGEANWACSSASIDHKCRPVGQRFRMSASGGTLTLAPEERQSLRHELPMVLENATVSGVLVEHEFGIRDAARHVDRVAARHHFVLVPIRHQHRLLDA